MRKFFVGIFFLSTSLQVRLFAQSDLSVKYAQTITSPDLKAHLSIIASDSFEGRNTGDRGQKLAASYIGNQFKKLGLAPKVATNDSLSYFQHFEVYRKRWEDPYIKIGDKEKKFMQDFFSLANPNIEKEEELELVFRDFGKDDISAVDLKDKGVVLLLGNILEKDKTAYKQKINNIILSSNYNKKFKQLLDSGARALFIIPGKSDSVYHDYLSKYKCSMEEPDIFLVERKASPNNIFFIPYSLGAQMMGLTLVEFQKIDQRKENSKKALPKIKLKAAKIVEPVITENVLGYIEGSDKKDEFLVITAHYDHEGIKCGQIYNGADDDGTGTVTILELAQAFALAKKEGNGPRRSILFMTVTGEEKGLLGSSYYTQYPVFPLGQTIADLNIDMIGRVDKNHKNEDYIYLIGSNRLSTQLHNISEEINKKYANLKLDYTYNATDDPNQFYYRSDHYNFAKNNIPVIFYFSGVHDDYHQPTDDIEKILFNKVEKTARLIFHTAWELVNREERIYVDVKQ